MRIMVTGGAGFIGSNLVHYLLTETDNEVIIIDNLTYAGNEDSLKAVSDQSNYRFDQTDITDMKSVKAAFERHQPESVMHLAAESHVDRSIDEPGAFIQTNIFGTYNLLQTTYEYWVGKKKPNSFRFLHVSTDEVYGSLNPTDPAFTEHTPYSPNSPYSASKAASDHLVRAWHATYGLPVMVTNCSNNYGPFQFPEKLIPVVILKCLKKSQIPVYGKGENVRDWLYVTDHVRALHRVLRKGKIGETYNIGGNNEQSNLVLVRGLCGIMDELFPLKDGELNSYSDLIHFVEDRPGHDFRYGIDSTKISEELSWAPLEDNESGMRKTVEWYLTNKDWWGRILSGEYSLQRQGIGAISDQCK